MFVFRITSFTNFVVAELSSKLIIIRKSLAHLLQVFTVAHSSFSCFRILTTASRTSLTFSALVRCLALSLNAE